MSDFAHRPPYMVSGQSGAALGPARVSIESLGINTLRPIYRSMEADTLQWVSRGEVVPEYLQEVSIWDADGKRIFVGVCTVSDPDWNSSGSPSTRVEISGALWWLEQAQLTSLETDDTDAEQERASFLFPSQDLAISIRSLLDRMESLGVPLTCGDIDETFAVPQMIFQGDSAANALRTMLAWMKDAMTWVEYDTDGLPKLHVTRRPTATRTNLDLQTHADLTGKPRINQKREMRPAVVKVQAMEVNATGEVIYTEDVAGDESQVIGPLGKQILTLSGPGRSDFRSYTPRVAAIQTETITPTQAQYQALDPIIAQAIVEYGGLGITAPNGDFGQWPDLPRGITGGGTFRVISGEVVDFLKTEFGVIETSTRISGWLFGTYIGANGWGESFGYLIATGRAYGGYVSTTSGVSPNYCTAIFVDFTIPTINLDLSTLRVFVHPEDQALVTPVPKLAHNLFKAQDWPHFTGDIPLNPGSPIPMPGSTVNVRGGSDPWKTMNALVSSSSIDLQTGAGSISLGPAQRIAAGSLLSQFNRPASGRIISL